MKEYILPWTHIIYFLMKIRYEIMAYVMVRNTYDQIKKDPANHFLTHEKILLDKLIRMVEDDLIESVKNQWNKYTELSWFTDFLSSQEIDGQSKGVLKKKLETKITILCSELFEGIKSNKQLFLELKNPTWHRQEKFRSECENLQSIFQNQSNLDTREKNGFSLDNRNVFRNAAQKFRITNPGAIQALNYWFEDNTYYAKNQLPPFIVLIIFSCAFFYLSLNLLQSFITEKHKEILATQIAVYVINLLLTIFVMTGLLVILGWFFDYFIKSNEIVRMYQVKLNQQLVQSAESSQDATNDLPRDIYIGILNALIERHAKKGKPSARAPVSKKLPSPPKTSSSAYNYTPSTTSSPKKTGDESHTYTKNKIKTRGVAATPQVTAEQQRPKTVVEKYYYKCSDETTIKAYPFRRNIEKEIVGFVAELSSNLHDLLEKEEETHLETTLNHGTTIATKGVGQHGLKIYNLGEGPNSLGAIIKSDHDVRIACTRYFGMIYDGNNDSVFMPNATIYIAESIHRKSEAASYKKLLNAIQLKTQNFRPK